VNETCAAGPGDCERALEQHSLSLLGLPGVVGIGVGAISPGQCCLILYTESLEVSGLPTEVTVKSGTGRTRRVRVKSEYQGPIRPE
jgi:hypothetical protein